MPEGFTDGEVTQKQIVPFRRIYGIVAFLFGTFKVKPKAMLSVAGNDFRLHNLETDQAEVCCIRKIFSCPSLMSICHLAGMFSAASNSFNSLSGFQ